MEQTYHNPYHNTFWEEPSFSVYKHSTNAARKDHETGRIRLFATISGHGTIKINGINYPISRGSLSWIFPYHSTSLTEAKNLEVIEISFPLRVLLQILDGSNQEQLHKMMFQNHFSPVITYPNAKQLEKLFNEALQEAEIRAPLFETLVLANVTKIILLYLRYIYKEKPKFITTPGWKALRYLHYHFAEPLSTAKVAQHFNATPERLNQELKALTGKNLLQNLTQIRFNHARALMQVTDLQIKTIASNVGFRSFPSFNRQFKQLYKETPKEYHKEASKKAEPTLAFQIYMYMTENFKLDLSLSSLEKVFFTSRKNIEQALQTTFQMNARELATFIKISYAKSFIQTTSLSFSQISDLAGFTSVRSFNRAFLSEVGMTPREYKKSLPE
ncbi:helix-turn-helix domain-containing protein [Listeria aquatica]|uniref:helix-turn-helix domain-containing protein n=1 Tax=Listeria aquatica TaxID=1494960 RepID=UPI003F6F5A3C